MKASLLSLSLCVLLTNGVASWGQSSPKPVQPPNQIHFHGPLHSMTLYWDGSHYVSKTETGVIGVWLVLQFTSEAVIIRRIQADGFEAVYKGQISADGRSLTNVTMNGGPAYGATFTWDSALNAR
jgi:hypothetical protein